MDGLRLLHITGAKCWGLFSSLPFHWSCLCVCLKGPSCWGKEPPSNRNALWLNYCSLSAYTCYLRRCKSTWVKKSWWWKGFTALPLVPPEVALLLAAIGPGLAFVHRHCHLCVLNKSIAVDPLQKLCWVCCSVTAWSGEMARGWQWLCHLPFPSTEHHTRGTGWLSTWSFFSQKKGHLPSAWCGACPSDCCMSDPAWSDPILVSS